MTRSMSGTNAENIQLMTAIISLQMLLLFTVQERKKRKTTHTEKVNAAHGGTKTGRTYINPDVGGLFIDDVRLRVHGDALQAGLPLSRVICDRDEERWRQQDQLQFPLTAVQ